MITETKKREIETMLDEYGKDLDAYAKWITEWRQKQRGFRCKRKRQEAAE